MTQPLSEQAARQRGELRNILYRAWPTRRDYSFTFVYLDNGWRIYINNSPNYGARPSGSLESHRLDIGARPYICWSPNGSGHMSPIPTLSEAQGVAALWADCTENYLATGRFEPAAGRPRVQDRSVLNGNPPSQAPLARARPTAPPAQQTARPRRSLWAEIRDQLFN